jgi:hypothetical protein
MTLFAGQQISLRAWTHSRDFAIPGTACEVPGEDSSPRSKVLFSRVFPVNSYRATRKPTHQSKTPRSTARWRHRTPAKNRWSSSCAGYARNSLGPTMPRASAPHDPLSRTSGAESVLWMRDVTQLTGVHRSTINRWISKGEFPKEDAPNGGGLSTLLPPNANARRTRGHLAGLKDRPSDLGTPRGLLGRVLRSH